MTELTLPAATIAALRTRHVAFLAERLTDERAHGDFVRSFEGAYDHILAQRIRDVVQPDAFVAGLAKILSEKGIKGFGAPIGHEIHRRVLASLRTHDVKLGEYVPDDARTAIDSLISRPDIVPEPLIRRVIEQEATEEILRDVLHDALREFNDSVNPFFAEWGLPALLKRVMPIGSGTVIKSIGAIRGEFDKRLEPEIRKFLLVFSRKAKGKIADFVVSKTSDPTFVALRKNVALFFYEQTLADVVAGVTEDVRGETDRAADAIVLEVVRHEQPRRRLQAALTAFVSENGDKTLGEWLTSIGVTERPELEPLAELLWPHVRLLLESPPARAFFERVAWDFYATLEAKD